MRSIPTSPCSSWSWSSDRNAYQKIDEYISHRLERERNILEAVRAGATTPKEIVEKVYTDISPKAHGMAERAVIAHLEKLKDDGRL